MGSLADEMARFLFQRGYGWYHAERVLRVVARFLRHPEETRGVRDVRDITDDTADLYARSAPDAQERDNRRRGLRLLMRFLREQGPLPASPRPEGLARLPIIQEYASFQVDHRGVSAVTTERNVRCAEELLSAFDIADVADMHRLDGSAIQVFVARRARATTPRQRKDLCGALRSFLRFLVIGGYIGGDLVDSIPVIPRFGLARLPKAIGSEAMKKILAAIDRSTPTGRRDYAMLVLLATYGMRCGQLLALKLDDIDWRHQVIRIPGAKGGAEIRLPLQPAVGEALVDYLRFGRPVGWPFREVFLRANAPVGPCRGRLGSLIKRRAERAGVALSSNGTHAWRHACATRMLAAGHALKTIRHVLGHRSIETTFIYTKIDLAALRKVAMEWPGELTLP